MASQSQLQKITIRSVDGPQIVVSAQYNPKEVSFQKSVKWADQESQGDDFPGLQFSAGGAVTMSLELLFDKYEEGGDVRKYINQLMALAQVDPKLKRPPVVQLVWGGQRGVLFSGGFVGVVESLTTKYTMFTPEGIPCRAVATVALKQAEDVKANEEVGGSHYQHKGDKVTCSSSQELANLAKKHGMDLGQLCDANGIDDPAKFKGGSVYVPKKTQEAAKPKQADAEVQEG